MTALTSQAAVSLISNQGDIGAVLRDLGSSASLRQLATAMVTAGVVSHATASLGIDTSVSAAFAEKLQAQAIRVAVSTAAEAGLNGGDLGEVLRSSLVNSAVTLASAPLFQAIGDLEGKSGPLGEIAEGDITKVLAHAAAGCAVGQLSSRNCLAGAIGSGLQEVLGAGLGGDPQTNADLSGLVGAVAVALAGGDEAAVYTANRVGQMAATFNRQLHTAEIKALEEKARELAGTGGLSEAEWKARLGKEALRRVDAQRLRELGPSDPEAAAILTAMAASDPGFADALGNQLNFLTRDDQFENTVYLAAEIGNNRDFYDTVLAEYAPLGMEGLTGRVAPSTLAMASAMRHQDASMSAGGGTLFGGDLTQAQEIARLAAVEGTRLQAAAVEAALNEQLGKIAVEIRDGDLSGDERASLLRQEQQLKDLRSAVHLTQENARTALNTVKATGFVQGVGDFAYDTAVATAVLVYDTSLPGLFDEAARARNAARFGALIELAANIDELPAAIAASVETRMAEAARLSEAGDIRGANAVMGELSAELASFLVPGAGVAGAAGGVVVKAGTKAVADLSPKIKAIFAKASGGRALDTNVSSGTSGFYDPRAWRQHYEDFYNGNVTSATVPPFKAPNIHLAGQRHPQTGVVFDQRGFPIFDDVARYDTRLPVDQFRATNHQGQMRLATRDLRTTIETNSQLRSQFESDQLQAIQSGRANIPRLTWHHHQDTGRMQLVPREIHISTGHTGGVALREGQ